MTKNAGLTAKWIWKKQESTNPYQQVVMTRKFIRLKTVGQAEMRISTDGGYRLLINGRWVNDGPCRSWPEHYQFDTLDVTSYLAEGQNEITIIARHWSAGNFHTIPRQAGLLAQLDIMEPSGLKKRMGTDESWLIAEAPAWVTNTPKASIQMEPQELYDARLEDNLVFEPAQVLFTTSAGPWQDLHARDSALLTLKPRELRSFLAANIVKHDTSLNFCIPTARLANPDTIEANMSVGNAGGMAALLKLETDALVRIQTEGFRMAIDGLFSTEGIFQLTAGFHFLLAFSSRLFGHAKESSLCLIDPPQGLRLLNPLDAGHENPWCWINMPDFYFQGDDINWPFNHDQDGEREHTEKRYEQELERLLRLVKDRADFQKELGAQAVCLPSNEMFVIDPHAAFLARQVLADGAQWLLNPGGLIQDDQMLTVVNPASDGDIELVYDLGEQNIGYYEIEMEAQAGVQVDLFGVEYINPQGAVQHTWGNRNGMRYVTREGRNHFISLKRRSQRYLFITLRNQTRPIQIRNIRLIESTYPVKPAGSFECSDSRLTRIYEISAHTLKLCMEDTFTDCPLFEQTLWVGDARNEALYNFSIFGAQDIVQRCIRLAAQSLERYPIIGCQLPSSWDCLLPAWSFLWSISVWDYYKYSANLGFLKEMWPAVLRNLSGAEGLLNDQGLFSGNYWNMFDWSGIDDKHATVLHNSMLLVGAIEAAQKMAEVLHARKSANWLAALRQHLKTSLNRLWDTRRQAYPDSIHADGTLSASISMHTSFLAILYDIIAPENYAAALNNLLQPADDMVKVGSPFAIQYLYEAFEHAGKADEIITSIYANYLPMLADGATTVWEMFPSSKDKPAEFPTRSHCHAWSSSPLHFLPRIILGLRDLPGKSTQAGGLSYEISPRPNGLTWAKGAVASPRGPVSVEWELDGKKLRIQAQAPEGVQLTFVINDTLAGLEIDRNF